MKSNKAIKQNKKKKKKEEGKREKEEICHAQNKNREAKISARCCAHLAHAAPLKLYKSISSSAVSSCVCLLYLIIILQAFAFLEIMGREAGAGSTPAWRIIYHPFSVYSLQLILIIIIYICTFSTYKQAGIYILGLYSNDTPYISFSSSLCIFAQDSLKF